MQSDRNKHFAKFTLGLCVTQKADMRMRESSGETRENSEKCRSK